MSNAGFLRVFTDLGAFSFSFSGVGIWQLGFLLGAIFFVAMAAWHGWRLGVLRQIMSILALCSSYLIGYFGGGTLGPFLHRFFDIPERVLAVIGAMGLGLIVYFCIIMIGVLFFKKTSQQRQGLFRLGYGMAGAVFGTLYGFFIVWIAILAIRLLGSVAETQIAAERNPRLAPIAGRPSPSPTPVAELDAMPSAMVRSLAMMKQSLERGPAGAVVQQVDPIPGTLYNIIRKLGVMASDEKSLDRFLSYPGVKPMLAHPKIAALQNDPEINKDIVNRNYFALLRNPRIVAAANDSELGELIRKFEFEKALDYAIRRPENDTAQNGRPPTP